MTNSTSSPTTQKATNKFWEFRNQANSQSAELLLYGDISQSSWWGDEVTPKQFADDLAGLGDVSEITVRIQENVEKAVQEYQNWQQKIGRDIDSSELIKLVREAGAKRPRLTAPKDVSISKTQVAKLNGCKIVYGGIEDD